MHKVITIKKGRIFFIGDLHGCYKKLIKEMKRVSFNPNDGDIIVSVGDLTDRGPDNEHCLNLLTQEWFVSIRGNHEQMMLEALTEGVESYAYKFWYSNGGDWYSKLPEMSKRMMNSIIFTKVNTLPILMTVQKGEKRIGVAHGGIHSLMWDDVVEQVNKKDVIEYSMWSRDQASAAQFLLKNKDTDRIPLDLIGKVHGVDAVVFGHTQMNKGPLVSRNMFWIDTGAVYGGKLCMLEFDDIIARAEKDKPIEQWAI
jgi:serine/threonine protein phosphatase 1